ncbi:MAG: hypothetical protein D6E12_12250 [Desulfovibrio sp.]|nr:MAG: hypothetical protein D6E12_12250 [Desulfovibrio sp.]
MGQFFLYTDEYPLADQIKALGDDELLDFWEETQFLDRFLEDEVKTEGEYSVEYERLILQELQIRSCYRILVHR